MNLEEQAYLDLLKHIIENGNEKSDRTNIGTRSIFGATLRFSLENNTIPAFTTKKIFFKGVIEELLFFLRGETNSKILENKNVNIWKGNTSRDFLDKRGLTDYPEGEMGPMYGAQWRNWDGEVDQIKKIINLLKTDPNSRRMLVSACNVNQLDKMVIELCHPLWQVYVNDNKLSLLFYMRSSDSLLGLPFNILSYGILAHILAKTCDLELKELIYMGGDVHIYNNHLEAVRTQIGREPYPFPQIKINKELSSIEDIEKLQFSDFEIINYQCHPAIKAEMAV